ncbi:MAG TPA: DUF456 domain-containing protein [Burkholderiaceae bacterium]|nr:DUF456 domain-containing protein [Burkholderiaceae bacterium]
MTEVLWILAVVLVIVGLAGTVLPALPGVPLIFIGVLVAAWAENFERITGVTIAILAVLTVIGVVIDYVAASLSAKRAGASRAGLVGAALGTIAGIVTGLWGLLFMPLVGAAIGEFISHRDALRAGRVGVATWVGLLAGTVVKLAVAFTMIGVFVAAIAL